MTGLGTCVLHTVAGSGALPALQDRIRLLQAAGTRPLVITALHSATALVETLADVDGIDVGSIGFIDCTGEAQADVVGDDILFIESPTMLESLLVRTGRLLRRMGPDTAVVVYTLDTFTLYVDNRVVAEFAQCLINNLQIGGFDVEFITVDGQASRDVSSRIDAHVSLGP